MTTRHKSIHFFTWLLCFLTFYLGFNHQVMCYELLPQGGIHKIHLQIIECNPLAPPAITSEHSPGKNMPANMSAGQAANGCPACRDFHISFKKNPGLDSLSIGSISSYLLLHSPLISSKLITNFYFKGTKYSGTAQPGSTPFNLSLTSLKTTILLI